MCRAAAIQRMLGERLLDSWEEPIDPAEDPFDIGYAPPAHELNVRSGSRARPHPRAIRTG